MTTWVRIADGLVVEDPITLPGGEDPNEIFAPLAYAPVPEGAKVEQRMTWNGKKFGPAAPIVPEPPNIISDRQFAQQAALDGLITEEEALGWVSSGIIPPKLEALLVQLPAEQHFAASMMLAGATTFIRTNPITIALTHAFGWKDADRDAFWTAAAAL